MSDRREVQGLDDVFARLEELGEDCDRPSIAGVHQAFGDRSYGPFLVVPAVFEMAVGGWIPGVPTLLAAIIFLCAAQMVAGRSHLWIPAFIERRRIRGDLLRKVAHRLRPVGEWSDRFCHGRLRWLTRGPALRVGAFLCMLLSLTVPPLELVPFASSAPMAAIALFGLALIVRDGLLMLAAAIATGGALWLVIVSLV